MRSVWSVLAAMAMFWAGSEAMAQTGLYGSPEMIPLSNGQPFNYASTAAPAAQSVPLNTAVPQQYAATPASYGQATSGPYLAPPQGYPTQLIQTSSETPAPPSPEVVPAPPIAAGMEPVPSPVPAAGAPSVLDQLLQESDCGATGTAPGLCGGAGCGMAESCDVGSDCCEPCLRNPWYFSTTGLVLTRNQPNRVWVSHEAAVEANQLMNTADAKIGWEGGMQFTVGRRFCCDQWAVEGTFWGMGPMHGYCSLSPGGGALGSPLIWNDLLPDPAGPFDGADAHYVERINEVYNVELNFLRHPMQYTETLSIDWLAGFRWFHFREHLVFGACDAGGSWSDPADCGYLDYHIQNDLLGAQVGLKANWCLGYNLSLFARPKFGIYNNHIDGDFDLTVGGQHVAPTAASGVPGSYPVRGEKDTIAFITEFDLGFDWQLHPQWTASLGYRVFLATNVGLADSQIAVRQVDIPEIATIKDNNFLMLHGAFASLTYSF